MEQTTQVQNRPLMLSPKALDRALALSAQRAQRMADAFGLKVPVAPGPKASKAGARTGRVSKLAKALKPS